MTKSYHDLRLAKNQVDAFEKRKIEDDGTVDGIALKFYKPNNTVLADITHIKSDKPIITLFSTIFERTPFHTNDPYLECIYDVNHETLHGVIDEMCNQIDYRYRNHDIISMHHHMMCTGLDYCAGFSIAKRPTSQDIFPEACAFAWRYVIE